MKLIQKFFWVLAPIFWGYLIWFLGYSHFERLLHSMIPWSSYDYNIKLLFRSVVGVIAILIFFSKSFNYAQKNYQLTFWGYKFWVPDWKFLISLVFIGLIFTLPFIPTFEWIILDNIINSVLISAIFEELITHGYFIKYKMGSLQFIFFNILSSITFSLMHYFYTMQEFLAYNLITNYFIFGFTMGIIAYKSQRIELPIILHMGSNFINYTLVKLILNIQDTTLVNMIYHAIILLVVAGISYRDNLDVVKT